MAARTLGILLILGAAAGCSRSPSRPLGPDNPAPPRALGVAAGTLHSCAMFSQGRVDCWGSNDRGQLGASASESCVVEDLLHDAQPARRTPCRATPAPVDGISDAIQIAAGGSTSCALRSTGAVRCWGANGNGLVGDGSTTDRSSATDVKGIAKAVQIAMSATHACARLENGEVACWGENFFGQLGIPPKDPGREAIARGGYAAVKELVPVRVPGLDQVEEIGVGEKLSCARRKNGEVLCFGQFAPGVVANPTPSVVARLSGVEKLMLGQSSHAALDASGALRGWGSNRSNQLQDGSKTDQKDPVTAKGLPPLSRVAWSAVRACAVTHSGDAVCWGDSGRNSIDAPTKVELPTSVNDIALGANHACVVGADGSVYCWGDGFYGETGLRNGARFPTSAFWNPPHRVFRSLATGVNRAD